MQEKMPLGENAQVFGPKVYQSSPLLKELESDD
jgi:hypothetical protein